MNIKQFRYSTDNLGYLLYTNKSAVAIDGGAVDTIVAFAAQNSLKIEFAVHTHSHADHTTGLKSLLKASGAAYLDQTALLEKGSLKLADENIHIISTPGHTKDSVTFHAGNFLVTGDTLFNGTIGNCFSGDLSAFLDSIKRLISFPQNTVIYAGHDYVKQAMAFAKWLEPDNKHIDLFLKKYDPNLVRSNLEDEWRVNPYLRFNDSEIISVLKQKGLPIATEWERWQSLMSLE
ncbi:MAG: hydroxyacylglutathione hydrolase [Desulfobacteraceae bacterium]|nr:MAG: hydroxyacylglutathione hydrolase [Desulfobacteraceae bacterium]